MVGGLSGDSGFQPADSFDVLTLPRRCRSESKKSPRPAEKQKTIVPRHAMRVVRPPAEVKVG